MLTGMCDRDRRRDLRRPQLGCASAQRGGHVIGKRSRSPLGGIRAEVDVLGSLYRVTDA